MTEKLDVIIIGGGIVGAAIARELSRYELSAVLLEAREDLARGASGANSGIIHAGYDPKPGSLMAKYNVKGNQMYPELCQKLQIPFHQVGSFVLAFNEAQQKEVQRLYERGLENGVPSMQVLSGEEVRRMEPQVSEKVTAALYAPTAGIISPYEATIALAENAAENGVVFRLNEPVMSIEKTEGGFKVKTKQDTLQARLVINCAGAHAGEISKMAGAEALSIQEKKGEYTLYDRSVGGFVQRVIFQTPDENGKGVLVTPTAEGNLLIGPSSDALEEPGDTATTQAGQDKIFMQAKKSCEKLPFGGAITSFAGIRAVCGEDFVIGESAVVPAFIQVAGICSPGLTSAPAIAQDIAELVKAKLGDVKEKSSWKETREASPCVRELSWEERKALCEKDADYGKIVCRCETVTEGEIRHVLRSAVPVYTVDGVKRRCRAGMGRCQGSFCTPRVMQIIAEEAGISLEAVRKAGNGTEIVQGYLKGVE
ncbi:MAG: NAD(P)/FAD-dependent oxidoreductase [Lachnospiraceae bacterium]|nr:NAD(P)/FAD-dependent oxidoreductase [Lachnospiraceae bacterium]